MLLHLLLTLRKGYDAKKRIRRDYVWFFLVCVATLLVSLLFNGGLDEYSYWEKCLAYYLVCIVAYFAVDTCVKNWIHFNKFIFCISLIVILDSTITILQYFNEPIGWIVGTIFSETEEFAAFFENHDSLVGVSLMPGIFGHPVNNGFFLGVTTPLLMAGIRKDNSFFLWFYYAIVIIISFIACLYLQQRAAFFLLLLFIFYHFFKTAIKYPWVLVSTTLIMLFCLIFFLPDWINSIEMGRLSETDNSSRDSVWRIAYTVISRNLMFGNLVEYNKIAGYSAHNLFVDSLIDSGLFGFIPIFILVLKTLWDSLRFMLMSKDSYVKVFSYSVLTCMAMGMFHNTSYLTGDVIIFIVLAMMFKAQKLSSYSQIIPRS